jgi:hypothetical protein
MQQVKTLGEVVRLCRPTLKTSGCRKDKPAGSGLPKPIRMFFSLLPAGLIVLARRFERRADSANR